MGFRNYMIIVSKQTNKKKEKTKKKERKKWEEGIQKKKRG